MKIICIGRNYVDHIQELKNEMPESMVIFLKPESSIHPIDKPWSIPNFSNDIHYECEIVLKINKAGRNISENMAADYFDEITLGIDFTARDIQSQLKEKGLPWEKSKAFDGSALIGKFISKNTLNLPDLKFSLLKNNEPVQNGCTKYMIHSFASIVSEVSKYFTLMPEDRIFTGTPAGVASVKERDHFIGNIETIKVLEFSIAES